MFNIATPISNLFMDKNFASILIENSDCLEVRDDSIDTNYPHEILFHCELQPIHKMDDAGFAYLKKVKDLHQNLKLITFHCASSCDKTYIENGMFQVSGNNYKKKDLFNNAKYNFARIKRIFGDDVKIGIENNNYFPTEAYRYVTDPEFISEIIYENNLYFLFDIAHAKITAHNKNVDYEEYKNNLPFDRIIQLHISSHSIRDELAYDAHDYPNENVFNDIKDIISKHEVEYLTIEYYKDVGHLLKALKTLKEMRG